MTEPIRGAAWRWRRPRALATLPLIAVAVACSGSGAGETTPEPGVPVTVARVEQRPMPVEVRAVGSVESPATVAVRARVGGEITHVYFEEGDEVHQGDLLFTIDQRPLQAALREAEARLARDRALAANARQDVERYRDLVAKDYVTQEQFDSIRTTAESQEATVAADEAAVESARLMLQYATIRAPITGRTGRLLVDRGNVIKANDDNPLVVIHQIQPIEVSFAVPQRHLAAIRSRAAGGELDVAVTVPDSGGATEHGTLAFIDNAVDPDTGTIQLKARFANREDVLWPGQFVNVALRLATQEDAVVAPASAVQPGQQGDFVFVLQADQTVESRPVTVDRTVQQQAVIAEGLAPGETVVTDGQLRLVPGARVEVKEKGPDSEEQGS